MSHSFPQRLFRRGLLASFAAVALLGASLAGAQERSWGPKTVQITVGFAPGGGVDLLEGMVGELHARLPSVAKAGNLDAEALRTSHDHMGAWFGLR